MKNGVVKITYKIPQSEYELTSPKRRRNIQKEGHCKRCGALLVSELSKRRGYGHRCMDASPLIIILDIKPSQSEELERQQ